MRATQEYPLPRLTRVVFASIAMSLAAALSVPSMASASTLPVETFSSTSISPTSDSTTDESTLDVSNDIVAATPAPSSRSKKSTSSSTDSTRESTAESTAAGDEPAAAAKSTEKVYVAVVRATSTTADDDNAGLTDTAKVRAFIAKLNAYWSEESDGAVTVVFAGLEVTNADAASCVPRMLFTSAQTDAFDGRFAKSAWRGTHEHLAILTTETCDRAGLGTIGGDGGIIFSGNGISNGLALPTVAHEFGHNLGFGHAGSSVCRSTTDFDGHVADFGGADSACPTNEYGDFLDIMGYSISGSLPHASSAQRILRGYLRDYTTLSGSAGTSTITVGSLDGDADVRAIKIVDPLTNDNYYVEYRTATGTDATSTEFTRATNCQTTAGYSACGRSSDAATGSVRILRELPYGALVDYRETTVLAVGRTGSNLTARNTHLAAGESFTSTDGGFSLVVNSMSPTRGASISVRLGDATGTSTALTLSGTKQTYGSSARVTATATVNREDSGTAKGSVQFFSGSSRLATVAVAANGTAAYRLPSSLAAGNRPISARFVPASIAHAPSSSAATTVSVGRALASTRITLLKSSVSKSSRAKVKVAVKVSGAVASGKLYAYANGKKIASYTLSSARKGVLTITLPRVSSSKKISVKYSGNANVYSAVSAIRKLSVKK